jgi:small subunit ribosomal protein S1
MHVESSLEAVADEMDFAALLEASFTQKEPDRGEIINGTILAVDLHGLIVDVGVGRDGVVPRKDIERLQGDGLQFRVGEPIDVMVVRTEDEDGNLVLSVSQARQSEDWRLAEKLLQNDEIWEGIVTDANRGGLIVPFGNLRGFVPASHVVGLSRGLTEDDRQTQMSSMVGGKITVKVIEVNWKRRRLVFSQREAQRDHREARKEVLLDKLEEGEIRRGVVSGLRDFGAFVDLGGADGLIHISELAWHRVKHPREVLNVGDEVEVYVLRLDEEGKRIGLSLKRLQENPWETIETLYHVGQLVEGRVSRIAQFGAFVSMEPGIEALLHVSQMADPPPEHPSLVVHEGQHLLMRVISIETDKQRLGLSLKEVTEDEFARWDEKRRAELEKARAEAEASAEADHSTQEAPVVELAEDVGEAELATEE